LEIGNTSRNLTTNNSLSNAGDAMNMATFKETVQKTLIRRKKKGKAGNRPKRGKQRPNLKKNDMQRQLVISPKEPEVQAVASSSGNNFHCVRREGTNRESARREIKGGPSH
jgi:hypothetical protein